MIVLNLSHGVTKYITFTLPIETRDSLCRSDIGWKRMPVRWGSINKTGSHFESSSVQYTHTFRASSTISMNICIKYLRNYDYSGGAVCWICLYRNWLKQKSYRLTMGNICRSLNRGIVCSHMPTPTTSIILTAIFCNISNALRKVLKVDPPPPPRWSPQLKYG